MEKENDSEKYISSPQTCNEVCKSFQILLLPKSLQNCSQHFSIFLFNLWHLKIWLNTLMYVYLWQEEPKDHMGQRPPLLRVYFQSWLRSKLYIYIYIPSTMEFCLHKSNIFPLGGKMTILPIAATNSSSW